MDCQWDLFDPNHEPVTLENGYKAEVYICLPEGDIDQFVVSVSLGSAPDEVRWKITRGGVNGPLWLEGGAPYMNEHCPIPTDSPIPPPSQFPTVQPHPFPSHEPSQGPAPSPTRGPTAPELSGSERENMKKVFAKLDTSMSGTLDWDELEAALVGLGHPEPVTTESVFRVLTAVGLSHKDELDLVDFERLWMYSPADGSWSFRGAGNGDVDGFTNPDLTPEELKKMEAVFRKLDTTDSGGLDRAELAEGLAELNHPEPTVETVDALLASVGLDDRKELDLEDFERLWRYSPPSGVWSFKKISPWAMEEYLKTAEPSPAPQLPPTRRPTAPELSAAEFDAMKKVFVKLDTSKSGTLDRAELRAALKGLGHPDPSDEAVDALLIKLRLGEKDELDLDDFERLWMYSPADGAWSFRGTDPGAVAGFTNPELTTAERMTMEAVFDKLDTSHNGLLDRAEIMAALVGMEHPEPTAETTDALLASVGLGEKQELTLTDFEKLWRYNPKAGSWSFKRISPSAVGAFLMSSAPTLEPTFPLLSAEERSVMEAVFARLDLSGNGGLDRAELLEMLIGLECPTASASGVEAMLREVGLDGASEVDLAGFEDLWRHTPQGAKWSLRSANGFAVSEFLRTGVPTVEPTMSGTFPPSISMRPTQSPVKPPPPPKSLVEQLRDGPGEGPTSWKLGLAPDKLLLLILLLLIGFASFAMILVLSCLGCNCGSTKPFGMTRNVWMKVAGFFALGAVVCTVLSLFGMSTVSTELATFGWAKGETLNAGIFVFTRRNVTEHDAPWAVAHGHNGTFPSGSPWKAGCVPQQNKSGALGIRILVLCLCCNCTPSP